jgi:hypothetical protein
MVAIPSAVRVGDLQSGEPVPDGRYTLRCSKATFKTSKKTDKGGNEPMIEAEFTIIGPEEQEEHVGRKIFENLMLAGQGSFRTRAFLTAAGFGQDDSVEDTDQFVDVEMDAIVGTQKGQQGYPDRNRVTRWMTGENA